MVFLALALFGLLLSLAHFFLKLPSSLSLIRLLKVTILLPHAALDSLPGEVPDHGCLHFAGPLPEEVF